MFGVHVLNDKVFISNDRNIVKAPMKNGDVAYFQLDKKAMQFDCLVINNNEITEEYTFYPQEKRVSDLKKIVEFVCEKFKQSLKDENIPALIKAIDRTSIE